MVTSVSLEDLSRDPAAAVAPLRPAEVVWIDAMDGWLVIGRAAAIEVLRDPTSFTVDDPRFTTSRVVGPSMLSLDGPEHRRHRDPFVPPFRRGALGPLESWLTTHADSLVDAVAAHGRAELRTEVAGPLASASIHRALGLVDTDPELLLRWYRAIAGAVSSLSAGDPPDPSAAEAMASLTSAVDRTIDTRPDSMLAGIAAGDLTRDEVARNTAVVLFGAIETAEGMTANALWHLLSHPDTLGRVRDDPTLVPAVVEESLRLEPAASVVDRYATADTSIGTAQIRAGDLVRVSLTAAGRDPVTFTHPDRFDIDRPDARLHLAFATGPHLCIGLLLARIETTAAIRSVLDRLACIEMAPEATEPSGLIFRKPDQLWATWTT